MILYFWLIVLIVLICGGIGGARNYLAESAILECYDHRLLARRLIEATAAAAIVPLFLSAIGNDVAGTVLEGSAGQQKWLYAIVKLIGFSILAALYSKNFLDNVSAKLLQVEKDLNKEKKQVRAVEKTVAETKHIVEQHDKIIVEDLPPTSTIEAENSALHQLGLSVQQTKILSAFDGAVPARSLEGLTLTVGQSPEEVSAILYELEHRGLTSRIEVRRGTRWMLTAAGRIALSKSPDS